jgi:LysM repeat protein
MTTKTTITAIILLLWLPLLPKAQEPVNAAVLAYINAYRDVAVREMQRTGVPASIKLAQGILETEAGRSDLVLRSNNHFGIKCKSSWTGEKVYHDDDARGECFRKYSAAEDSWKDHSDYLRSQPRYASLFSLDPMDYKGWAHGLKRAGYATNPRYPQILIKYIETYNLNDYTEIALGRMAPKADMALSGPGADVDANPVSVLKAGPMAEQGGPVVTQPQPAPSYPAGEFRINDTRVIFAEAGTSLLSIATDRDIRLSWLLDFNDLPEGTDMLGKGQLIYLQRKRRHGQQEFHEVASGETLHEISQREAIRLESLMSYNHLSPGMQPAAGTKLYLQRKAPERPALAEARPAVNPGMAESTPDSTAPVRESQEIRHVVQAKETLFSLARKYDVGLEQIKAWNRLEGEDLKVGQELVIFK